MAEGRSFTVAFDFGDRVYVDGDSSIKGTVTAFIFRAGSVLVEVSWMHSGKAENERFEDYRLTAIEKTFALASEPAPGFPGWVEPPIAALPGELALT